MILAVTGFVEIPGHPRPVDEYLDLSDRLFDADIPLVVMDGRLELCWLHRYLWQRGKYFSHSTADNPAKNSVAYHCVQAEKSEWLALAADLSDPGGRVPDVVVWIDLGIFSLPGMTAGIVREFMQRAESEQAIAIPGCWDLNFRYDDQFPVWRFCGGLWVVARKYVGSLDAVMKDEYKRWLEVAGNLSWEVNTLARVEANHPELPIRWYKADHDASMFLNYRPVEDADGSFKDVRG